MKFVRLFVLLALCATLLIGGGYMIGPEALFFGILVFAILVSGILWLSDKIVLKICNAERLTVHHSPSVFGAVQKLCEMTKTPMPKIYVIPGETPNAFSTGLGRRHGAIAVTEGIISHLSKPELRAVLAHEIAHIKSRDNLVGSLASTFAGLAGMGIGRFSSAKLSVDDSLFRKLGKSAVVGFKTVIAPIASSIIRSLVRGSREYKADECAAVLTGEPLAMASAIRTMEKKKHLHPLYVSPVVAHLFTVNPLIPGRILKLFNTHPPMEERITRLEAMALKQSAKQIGTAR